MLSTSNLLELMKAHRDVLLGDAREDDRLLLLRRSASFLAANCRLLSETQRSGLLVGDRDSSDIAAAHVAGCPSLLIAPGVARRSRAGALFAAVADLPGLMA